MTSEALILPLARASREVEVGGKAANLARLIALSAPVPAGFVVTNAALRLFIDSCGLQRHLDALDDNTTPPASHPLDARAIAAVFRDHGLPVPVREETERAWNALSSGPVIVRSSAVGEDSGSASFAGQLASVADVNDREALARSLATVWASQWSDRVLSYQANKGVRLTGMGVIVQRQVAAVVSGVLFTRAPDGHSHMLLEYCDGMGEALVSGMVNPGRVRIARATFGWTQEAAPDPVAASGARLLNDARITSLARLGLQIEQAFGAAQDIEWTMDSDGRIWIVQARPITAGATDARDVAAATGPATVLWSNANVNENFPQPISPFLYSIAAAGYYHYFRNLGRGFGVAERRLVAMEEPLRHIIGVHGGRMYYNLSSIHSVLRSAPFGDLLAAAFDDFVGATDTAATTAAVPFRGRSTRRISQVGELAFIAAKTTWQYLSVPRRVARFEQTVSAFADRTAPDRLCRRSLSDLLGDLRAFMNIRCHRWNDAALADAGAMVSYGLLKRLLARGLRNEDGDTVHNSLLKALPNLVSGIPSQELWALSRQIREDARLTALFGEASTAEVLATLARDDGFGRFASAFRRYLDDWGFRSSGELMLTVPSFQEEPGPVVDLLRAYAAIDGPSPGDQLKQQERERLTETRRVLSVLRSHPLARGVPFLSLSPIVRVVLRWTQRSIQLRERARLKQALLYSRLRRVALALGDRLADGGRLARREDVFFLTWEEIDALASGHAMFPDAVEALVTVRREAHAGLARMRPPDTMRLAAGEYLPAHAGVLDPVNSSPRPALTRLIGVGACGGFMTGRAAILADVTESHRISPGSVLVTRQTDPGWGPIFPLIAGLVIERGGMLSHGAIIAREFGIPSVVGVKDATSLIPEGARISVDGDKGHVHLLVEAASC